MRRCFKSVLFLCALVAAPVVLLTGCGSSSNAENASPKGLPNPIVLGAAIAKSGYLAPYDDAIVECPVAEGRALKNDGRLFRRERRVAGDEIGQVHRELVVRLARLVQRLAADTVEAELGGPWQHQRSTAAVAIDALQR